MSARGCSASQRLVRLLGERIGLMMVPPVTVSVALVAYLAM